ncbi:WbqC family protein [Gillisia hiemivivida]|uniref:WbqC family protein n=1 Tax=Gillisia hiemivivida TaxID=291190 RepID=A0A5C6ZRM0_9FLAO|nr:WbqC family protein [Gillisia hiemivivida]TXD93304.1 WbqC family protein [Gillisia hiemivivida]
MKEILVSLPYFGPISQFKELVNPLKVWVEKEDNFQKQTYRNRIYIYGANGKLSLNIPIKHLPKTKVKVHQKYSEVKIDNDDKWQSVHWKSLKSAYQTSPFFEFYEDELSPLFRKEYLTLYEFNRDCLETVLECLQVDLDFEYTSEYNKQPEKIADHRNLINAKSRISLPEYIQVFQEKHGFISNLCILDLLFNEGPNAVAFLKTM